MLLLRIFCQVVSVEEVTTLKTSESGKYEKEGLSRCGVKSLFADQNLLVLES